MDTALRIINYSEGRDKFVKILLNTGILIEWLYDGESVAISNFLRAFTKELYKARKLFRFFQSVKEYRVLLELLKDREGTEKDREKQIYLVLQILYRLCMMFYYILDHIFILSLIINKKFPKLRKLQCCLDLIGNVASSASCLIKWKELRKRRGAAVEQRELQLKMGKLAIDLVATLNGTGILDVFMIKRVPTHFNALCNLGSAMISMYWHISKR